MGFFPQLNIILEICFKEVNNLHDLSWVSTGSRYKEFQCDSKYLLSI